MNRENTAGSAVKAPARSRSGAQAPARTALRGRPSNATIGARLLKLAREYDQLHRRCVKRGAELNAAPDDIYDRALTQFETASAAWSGAHDRLAKALQAAGLSGYACDGRLFALADETNLKGTGGGEKPEWCIVIVPLDRIGIGPRGELWNG